jgi:Clathrin adaptor complex small chain
VINATKAILWRYDSSPTLPTLCFILFCTAEAVILNENWELTFVVQFRNYKIVYRRYAGLFFCLCVDANDNELACLEAIHLFVEVLDAFFGNVCELDLVFNFYKVG